MDMQDSNKLVEEKPEQKNEQIQENSFKINLIDNDKNTVSTQKVTISNNEIDNHKISFSEKSDNNDKLVIIEADKKQMTLNFSSGKFQKFIESCGNELTFGFDQQIGYLKLNNIKMDYEDNLIFTVEGSKNTYRISGNSIEVKNGKNYEPLVHFDEGLDISLPSTIIDDISKGILSVDSMPYQMFDVLSSQNIDGLVTYESKNHLLHLVKYDDNLYVGRGSKLVPVNIDSTNLYKMGKNSVLGFTIGKNNGISGKQSSGIGFEMDEDELEFVSELIYKDKEKQIEFKTYEQFIQNDIDYTRVRSQNNMKKSFVAGFDDSNTIQTDFTSDNSDPQPDQSLDQTNDNSATPEQKDGQNANENTNSDSNEHNSKDNLQENINEDTQSKTPNDARPEEKEKENPKSTPDDSSSEEKENPKSTHVEITADMAAFFFAIMACLMISGVFTSVFALMITSILGVFTFMSKGTILAFDIKHAQHKAKNSEATKEIEHRKKIMKLNNKLINLDNKLNNLREKLSKTNDNSKKHNKYLKRIKKLENKKDKIYLKNQDKQDQLYVKTEYNGEIIEKDDAKEQVLEQQQDLKETNNETLTQQENLKENNNEIIAQKEDTKENKNVSSNNTNVNDEMLKSTNKTSNVESENVKPDQPLNNQADDKKELINNIKEYLQKTPRPNNDEERENYYKVLNKKVCQVFTDNDNVNNYPDEEKDLYQALVNYKNCFNNSKYTEDTELKELVKDSNDNLLVDARNKLCHELKNNTENTVAKTTEIEPTR